MLLHHWNIKTKAVLYYMSSYRPTSGARLIGNNFIPDMLYCLQGRRGATARSRTSRIPSQDSAAVCQTPRSGSMTWDRRRRLWTHTPTACTLSGNGSFSALAPLWRVEHQRERRCNRRCFTPRVQSRVLEVRQ